MGVRHLDNYIRESVPGGIIEINIEDEIRKYVQAAVSPSTPKPIIVIDLCAFFTPLGNHDRKGLYFGGRFNLAYTVMEEFFAKLKDLGVKLEFFYDGVVPEFKSETWSGRQDGRYTRMLQLIDAVDMGCNLNTLMDQYSPPQNFRFPLKFIAKKYGELQVNKTRECDQELAAYATKMNALAIISDDSDFLIYEGSWKYWSSRELELSTLSTVEYDRDALVSHLGLSFRQMPLFATLCGNDIMPLEVVSVLHSQLGDGNKFLNLAGYVNTLENENLDKMRIVNILNGFISKNDKDLLRRFRHSLKTYSVNINQQNATSTDDLVEETLRMQDSGFMFLAWREKPIEISIGVVDMRRNDFGRDYAQLQISLIVRMVGIILFHRKPKRPSHCSIVIKSKHQRPHQGHNFAIVYPHGIETPTLIELLSTDPVIDEHLQEVKFQLLSWIASNTLTPQKLQKVPHHLRMTVFTVYYLVEQQVLELFEADLLLQVAYDVSFGTYDFLALQYPETIESRPFRLVFFYQQIYALTMKAFRLVGLDENCTDAPPFDGVLFHGRYDDWSHGRYELEHIRKWRIYKSVGNAGSN